MKNKIIGEIIIWWEDELTVEEREKLMGNYKWSGTKKERHKKLKEMHLTYFSPPKEE